MVKCANCSEGNINISSHRRLVSQHQGFLVESMIDLALKESAEMLINK